MLELIILLLLLGIAGGVAGAIAICLVPLIILAVGYLGLSSVVENAVGKVKKAWQDA